MKQYLALLRGINVGGKNLIKMTDLAAHFESMGFASVRTYIQSGNVIFRADEADSTRLEGLIEEALSQRFLYDASLVLRSQEEIREVVSNAPPGFGSEPDSYRYDVIFLKGSITSADVMKSVNPKEGGDQAYPEEGVLYFSRLTSRASQSRLSRIAGSPVYPYLTIRNWNTTTKLLALMENNG